MQHNSIPNGIHSSSNLFPSSSSSRDLDVVLEETGDSQDNNDNNNNGRFAFLDSMLDSNYALQQQSISNTAYLMENANNRPLMPLRRSRAGTMPSLVYMESPLSLSLQPPPPLPPLPLPLSHPTLQHQASLPSLSVLNTNTTNNNHTIMNRHRSGSLNLPHPHPSQHNNSFHHHHHRHHLWMPEEPTSSEQLLQEENDFSIVHTLRSIGLDESMTNSGAIGSTRTNNNLRGRSYSVNNTPMYSSNNTINNSNNNSFHSTPSLESLTSTNSSSSTGNNSPTSNNRPRASSMSRMVDLNHSRFAPPGFSSLWKMQLSTLHDESFDNNSSSSNGDLIEQRPALSLGDSELLANIIQKQISDATVDNSSSSSNSSGSAIPAPQLPTENAIIENNKFNNSSISRSLWIGNIDASITADLLTRIFSPYGPIESVRLLLEKECAFINFFQISDAMQAKEDVLSNLGGRIGSCTVRIGYGRAESLSNNNNSAQSQQPLLPQTTSIEQPVVSQPTRALWIGNMPPNMSQLIVLQRLFSQFGVIESVRVLSHKNCAFINYESVESAMEARDALLLNDERVKEMAGIRVGFAKSPVMMAKSSSSPDMLQLFNNSNTGKGTKGGVDGMSGGQQQQANKELWNLMKMLGANEESVELVKSLQSAPYFESIPPVPEYGVTRRHDVSKLRDMRNKLDTLAPNDPSAAEKADAIAMDCMDEIAEICSDYIGNTVVQRLFEKCSQDIKTTMLKVVAPHLAAMGIHKNGTWAAQKIIDSLTTPSQIETVCFHIQPFIPPLLLDQFGNYVVQCCLRLKGTDHQFITNAMVEKFVHIAQGRFGARAMRGILEGDLISPSQKMFATAALIQNSLTLSTHANGALLVSWLIESCSFTNRLSLLSARLSANLTQVATHKLGSQILLKLLAHDHNSSSSEEADAVEAKRLVLEALENTETTKQIMSDQARGLNFVIKVLAHENLLLDEKQRLHEVAHPILTQLQGTGYKKALLEFIGGKPNEASDSSYSNKEIMEGKRKEQGE